MGESVIIRRFGPRFRRWIRRARYNAVSYLSSARGGVYTLLTITMVFLVLTVGLGLLRAVWVSLFGSNVERGDGFLRQIWITWLEMTDPGTQAYDIDSSMWVKVFAVAAGVAGIILLSTVIAVMTTAMNQKIEQLRSGRSEVLETGHTLILGWNDRVVDILHELIEANESEPDASVVILADRDKVDMDEFLALQVPDRQTTRIETRSGTPASTVDLKLVEPSAAKSAIVLRSEDPDDSPTGIGTRRADIAVLKTLMALLLVCDDEGEPVIVAEMSEPENIEIAETLDPDRITLISPTSMLAKIIVQCSRSQGLAPVYREMLSFEGAELYFHPYERSEPLLFRQVGWLMPDGVPIGLRTATGDLIIHPDRDLLVNAGDELLVLAEDDSTISIGGKPVIEGRVDRFGGGVGVRVQEQALLIGWTAKAPVLIEEFADYVAPGSTMCVMTRDPCREIADEVTALNDQLDTLRVELMDIDPHEPSHLEALELERYSNVMLLSQASQPGAKGEHTDSETLTMLLRLRRMLDRAADAGEVRNPEAAHGSGDRAGASASTVAAAPVATKLITEIVEAANHALVSEVGVDDIVISNRMISAVIAQVSEDPDRIEVFDDLFQEDGSEIYLKPVEWYFADVPTTVTFADVMAHGFERNEIALGVRQMANGTSLDDNFGVRLNLDKKEEITLDPGDTLVVVAVDEL